MDISRLVNAELDEMIRERQYFHQHPELSGQERETIQYIRNELTSLGIPCEWVEGGGLIGRMGPAEGPALILRADVDALPIQETEKNLVRKRTCISTRDGVMHACGHDAHMAMQLCAARILSRIELKAPILLIFEQGEEDNSGIRKLIPHLDAHYDIAAVYATHVLWNLPMGQVAICNGPAMAGGFGFDIAIHGQGGHGSRPDMAKSPIDCFTDIHSHLLQLRGQCAAPDSVLTYSLGSVNSGNVKNIIPEVLTFSGTVRTFDTRGAGEKFSQEMRKMVDQICQLHGCTPEYRHYSKVLYETYNNATFRKRVLDAARLAGITVAKDWKPWMASETLSAYLKLWPGVMSFTGIQDLADGCGAGHHTSEFDLPEQAMLTGATLAVAVALDWNGRPERIPFERVEPSLETLLERSL